MFLFQKNPRSLFVEHSVATCAQGLSKSVILHTNFETIAIQLYFPEIMLVSTISKHPWLLFFSAFTKYCLMYRFPAATVVAEFFCLHSQKLTDWVSSCRLNFRRLLRERTIVKCWQVRLTHFFVVEWPVSVSSNDWAWRKYVDHFFQLHFASNNSADSVGVTQHHKLLKEGYNASSQVFLFKFFYSCFSCFLENIPHRIPLN